MPYLVFLHESLGCIEVPVLVIQRTNERSASIAQVESIQKLSGGKVHSNMLENCGHTPHLDAKEKVLSLMTAFVKQYASKKNFSPEEVNIR
jgi:pimeloyl-ACP methyl ester carboxylesterase